MRTGAKSALRAPMATSTSPARSRCPHRVALARRERRVEDGDVVAEARAEARDELRRERDLGHEHDAPRARVARGGDGAQVHLGLAAAGDAVEEERRGARLCERARRWRRWRRPAPRWPRGARRAGTGSAKNGSSGASRSSIATRPSVARRLRPRAGSRHRCLERARAEPCRSRAELHEQRGRARPEAPRRPRLSARGVAVTHCTRRVDDAAVGSRRASALRARARPRARRGGARAGSPRRWARSSSWRASRRNASRSAGTAGSSSTTRHERLTFGGGSPSRTASTTPTTRRVPNGQITRAPAMARAASSRRHCVRERARERYGQRDVREQHRGQRCRTKNAIAASTIIATTAATTTAACPTRRRRERLHRRRRHDVHGGRRERRRSGSTRCTGGSGGATGGADERASRRRSRGSRRAAPTASTGSPRARRRCGGRGLGRGGLGGDPSRASTLLDQLRAEVLASASRRACSGLVMSFALAV